MTQVKSFYKNRKKIKLASFRQLLSAPFILFMIIPAIFFDIAGEIYHRIAFPLYGIALVERSKYIKIDRHKLSKLSLFNKLGCVYCGYVNGALAYWVEIAARTENYWCNIMHAKSQGFVEPEHHKKFEAREDFE